MCEDVEMDVGTVLGSVYALHIDLEAFFSWGSSSLFSEP